MDIEVLPHKQKFWGIVTTYSNLSLAFPLPRSCIDHGCLLVCIIILAQQLREDAIADTAWNQSPSSVPIFRLLR